MDKIFDLDLNDLVSKQVRDKIDSYELQINELKKKNNDLNLSLITLTKKLSDASSYNSFIDGIRETYNNLKTTGSYAENNIVPIAKKRYDYISNILKSFYNINEEYGWLSHGTDGALMYYLAANFYSNKQTLLDVLNAISPEDKRTIDFIKDFRMPSDYTKEEVIEFLEKPQYNTNGFMFGRSKYWAESGFGKRNMPYDYIFKSPHMLDDNVFDVMINTIEAKKNEHFYFFEYPIHNKYASDEQIIKLGRCLINLKNTTLEYDPVKRFINMFLMKFDDETLDFLFNRISDNQYSIYYWERFPVKFQMKYLLSQPLDNVLKTINNTKWTTDDKALFLKQYLAV